MSESIGKSEARRIALAAQGFRSSPTLRKHRPFDPGLSRLQVLQIDSVNVFSRSHYLPIFSRHGSYDREALDQLLWRSGEYTEYWAHEAAFIRVADRPLFDWRMREFRDRFDRDGRLEQLAPSIARVREHLAADGPSRIRDLEPGARSTRGEWWDWTDTKRAVEALFAVGDVVSVGRDRFERRYALTEHSIPDNLLRNPPTRVNAHRELVERAARSLGVATVSDLADYYRLKATAAKVAVQELVDSGTLYPVTVEGWVSRTGKPIPAWIHRDAKEPKTLTPDALLTPFDPVCWFRPRAERLFNFHYRIEIYTPAAKRIYGYYCLPLMVDGDLVGRIDLKADRHSGTLLVQAAWQEDSAPAHTTEVATKLLEEAANWQNLGQVRSTGVGNLPIDA